MRFSGIILKAQKVALLARSHYKYSGLLLLWALSDLCFEMYGSKAQGE